LVRKIEASLDFDFIYELVEEYYCSNKGRPSIDPVVLIKIALVQYLCSIRPMRQTTKEIETTVAYRWFLLRTNRKNPFFHEINEERVQHGKAIRS
jgi:transposase